MSKLIPLHFIFNRDYYFIEAKSDDEHSLPVLLLNCCDVHLTVLKIVTLQF